MLLIEVEAGSAVGRRRSAVDDGGVHGRVWEMMEVGGCIKEVAVRCCNCRG